jgi:hypothetical protein
MKYFFFLLLSMCSYAGYCVADEVNKPEGNGSVWNNLPAGNYNSELLWEHLNNFFPKINSSDGWFSLDQNSAPVKEILQSWDQANQQCSFVVKGVTSYRGISAGFSASTAGPFRIELDKDKIHIRMSKLDSWGCISKLIWVRSEISRVQTLFLQSKASDQFAESKISQSSMIEKNLRYSYEHERKMHLFWQDCLIPWTKNTEMIIEGREQVAFIQAQKELAVLLPFEQWRELKRVKQLEMSWSAEN